MITKTKLMAFGCSILLILAVLSIMMRKGHEPVETPQEKLSSGPARISPRKATAEGTRAPASDSPRSIASEPGGKPIVTMGPADWTAAFQSSFQGVNADYKAEIVLLAGELQDEIAEGLDPASEDAKAYVEVIETLLSEEPEEDP